MNIDYFNKNYQMKKAIYIVLALITLMACETKNAKQGKEKEYDILQNKRDSLMSELTNKYAIKYSLDTLDYNYSIEFEELLKSDYQLISRFMINDIYKKDSLIYIKLRVFAFTNIYLNLTISQNQARKILSNKDNFFFFNEGVLIVKLFDIKKIDLTLESYPEDEGYCSIEFENSMSFLGKGEIIETHIIN
jgi:hypothetical protein